MDSRALPMIAPKNTLGLQVQNIDDLQRTAKLLLASGLFPIETDKAEVAVAQACTKIIAGAEFGLTPFIAMRSMHIVQGHLTPTYQLAGALIKRSGKYDFTKTEHDDKHCVIQFFENGTTAGFSAFSMDDARTQGLIKTGGNWEKIPKTMLFARALTNGANMYCAEVFAGPVYTPDQMGSVIDVEGNPVVEKTYEFLDNTTYINEELAERGKPTVQELKKQAKQEKLAAKIADPQPSINVEPLTVVEPIDQEVASVIPTQSVQIVETEIVAEAVTLTPPAMATESRPGRPGDKDIAELIQLGEKIGVQKSDVNKILVKYLRDNQVAPEEQLPKFKQHWTWEHLDGIVVAVKAAAK